MIHAISSHVAVRDERHQWVRTPGNKSYKPLKMRPMISADSAYAFMTERERLGLSDTQVENLLALRPW